MKIAIIGAGIAGTCAHECEKKGHEVTCSIKVEV